MQEIKFPIKVIFHKAGRMRYFSALDLVKILGRALRRSGLPLYFTQGFNPRVKMSFGRTLKLGVEGNVEVVFYFTEDISFQALKLKLSPQLPDGLKIINGNS